MTTVLTISRFALRIHPLPSRPFDADYFAAVHAGEPLDVDAVLAAAPILDDFAAQPAAQEGSVL